MKRNAWVLGIHDGHDAAAALLHDGRLVAAVSEERIQRVKSAAGFPAGAIAACLAEAGIGFGDIGHVAVAGTRAVPVNMLGTLSTFEIRDHYRIQEELRRPKFYEGRSVPFASQFPKVRYPSALTTATRRLALS
jgi:predicted NodU family carbamoyl transferase